MLVFEEGGKPENPEKNPRSRGENQQQTQSAGSGNGTRDTLVVGQRSHNCANPAPLCDSAYCNSALCIFNLMVSSVLCLAQLKEFEVPMAETDVSVSSNKQMTCKEANFAQELAFDYICFHKLGKLPYRSSTKAADTLREVGKVMEKENEAFFNDLKNVSMTAEMFNGIVDEMFSEKINWGRIVALHCFAGVLAVSRSDNHISDGGDVVGWLSEYMCQKEMTEWVAKAGGWNGFCEYFNDPPGINKELFGGWTGVTLLASIAAVLLVASTKKIT